jgi:hypothetical protein
MIKQQQGGYQSDGLEQEQFQSDFKTGEENLS